MKERNSNDEKSRRVEMESNRKIVDRQLQLQKSSLKKSTGIEKLEELRKQRDKELFTLIATMHIPDDVYLEEDDELDLDLDDTEFEDDEEDLTSIVSSFLGGNKMNTSGGLTDILQIAKK